MLQTEFSPFAKTQARGGMSPFSIVPDYTANQILSYERVQTHKCQNAGVLNSILASHAGPYPIEPLGLYWASGWGTAGSR